MLSELHRLFEESLNEKRRIEAKRAELWIRVLTLKAVGGEKEIDEALTLLPELNAVVSEAHAAGLFAMVTFRMWATALRLQWEQGRG